MGSQVMQKSMTLKTLNSQNGHITGKKKVTRCGCNVRLMLVLLIDDLFFVFFSMYKFY